MALRIFTSEEMAVFEQISEQRNESGPNEDYFIYSLSKGQKGLQSHGYAVGHGIGISEQVEIIHKMIEDRFFDADWVVSYDQGKFNLKYHNEEWLQKNYSAIDLSNFVFEDWNYRDCFFINLDFNRIRAINDNCRAIYPCELCYDEEQYSFYVKRKDNDESYYISKLRKDMLPFQVLLRAYKSKRMHATREGMNKSGDRRVYIGKASIATQVFAEKSVVRNELSMFVTLRSEDIDINKEANLTLNQLKALEKA